MGQFLSFVDELMEIKKAELEDEKESKLWDLYIHMIPFLEGQSFEDFKNSVDSNPDEPIEEINLEATLNNSQSILDGFIPS